MENQNIENVEATKKLTWQQRNPYEANSHRL